MFASREVSTSRSLVVVVPRAAVQGVGDRSVIYVAAGGEEGRCVERTIKLGVTTDDSVQVLEGLKPGEESDKHAFLLGGRLR